LLTGYLDTLAGILPGLDPAATVAARNATLELVLGVLRPGAVGNPHDLPLRAAMERFIEQHLTSMAITPDRIACEHGVSVRTVNRIFSTTGDTVGGIIQPPARPRPRRADHRRRADQRDRPPLGLLRQQPLPPRVQGELRAQPARLPRLAPLDDRAVIRPPGTPWCNPAARCGLGRWGQDRRSRCRPWWDATARSRRSTPGCRSTGW